MKKQFLKIIATFMTFLMVLNVFSFALSPVFAVTYYKYGGGISTVKRADYEKNKGTFPAYSKAWQYWSQGATKYSAMLKGCRYVAFSKLLAEMGIVKQDSFNPDMLFEYGCNNGWCAWADVAEKKYGVETAYASGMGYTLSRQTVNISGTNAEKAQKAMEYINNGYYVILGCKAHYAYVGRAASLEKGTAVIFDSWSSSVTNSSTLYLLKDGFPSNASASFDTLIYYKITKGPSGTNTGSGSNNVKVPPNIQWSNPQYPSGTLAKGKSFGLYGIITSNSSDYPLTNVTATVINTLTGATVDNISVSLNKVSYNINTEEINKKIVFNNTSKYNDGKYRYIVTASTAYSGSGGSKQLIASDFRIGNGGQGSSGTPVVPSPNPPKINATAVPGGYSVTVSAESGTEIHYTTNNTPATKYSPKYTEPFTVKSSCIIRAVAVKSGAVSGEATPRNISVERVAQPTINKELTSSCVCVTLSCSTPGAKIYYTLNGTTPTTNSYYYNNTPISLRTGATVKAFAVKDGYTDSAVTLPKTITITAPEAPGIEIPTGTDVAVGNPIEVRWTAKENATSHYVRIYRDDTLIDTVPVSGSRYVYIPTVAGSYRFGVDAVNFAGQTSSDLIKFFTAHDPVSIKFVNHDGSLIEEQSVRYGYSASAPTSIPKRKGWVFRDWDSRNYTHATTDMTITALWDREKYIIRFIDENGISLAPQQEVEYEGSVVLPPDPSNGIAGYKFMGWRAISTDTSSLLDYNYVDANLTLQAVYDWGNKDLPVAVQSATVTANDDGRHYTADYKLNNGWNETVYCRVVITLKTSSGKAVITDTRDVTIPPRGTFIPNENTEIICDKVATKAEINVVGLNGDLTGGAYALPYNLNITKTKYWSDWSTDPSNSDGSDGSVKTQYSYQTKSYTTSNSRPLSGWTEYGTPTYTDVWGNYGNWTTTRESTNELKQEQAGAQYRYYYYKCQNCGGRTPYYNITCPHCKKVKIGNNWNCTWSTTPYRNTTWYNWDSSKRYTYSLDGSAWFWSTGNTNATAIGTTDSSSSAVVIRQAYRYRTATRVYTYYYYKWGNWSNWSDDFITQTSERNVKKRELYRHLIADPVSNDGENNIGTEYTVAGNLSTLSADYSGKNAIIFVYKSQINDPTANAIKYVGNTVIGEGNTYNFSFVPSQSPDEANSNFTVALAVEGQTALMNIDVITSTATEYDVEFFADGISISLQKVQEGRDAIVPTPPEIPGKVFVGWNNDTTNIVAPRKIEALYASEIYSVVFVDFETDYVSMNHYQYGETISIPEVGEIEGKTFLGWEGLDEENPIATGHAVYIAKYETGTFTVKFDDGYGNIISTQTVEYGNPAELPDSPEIEGLIFMGWRQDSAWWNVKSDMIVTPIWVYENTVAPPNVNVENLYFGGEITAESDTEGATLYYAVDDGSGEPPATVSEDEYTEYNTGEELTQSEEAAEPVQALHISPLSLFTAKAYAADEEFEEETEYIDECELDFYDWLEYDGSMIFDEDATIYFYATSENMNDSEIVKLDYVYEPVMNPYEDHAGETHTVIFLDDDGFVLDEQTVGYFESAIAPEIDERDGYVFIGWDNKFDHVTEDIEVVAQYVPEDEYVTFKLSNEEITVTAGDTYSLSCTVENTPENMGDIIWKSSDNSVVTVSTDGLVMANSTGEAIITAKGQYTDYSASCKVTVLPDVNDTITLRNNSNLSLENGILTQVPVVLSNNRGVAAAVGEIKAQFATPNVKIVDSDGNEMDDSALVATNTQIRIIVDGIVVDAVMVIVTGDYDGNGKVNNMDASRIMRYLVNKETPDEYQLYASDVNKDGVVNNKDAAMLPRYLIGKEVI